MTVDHMDPTRTVRAPDRTAAGLSAAEVRHRQETGQVNTSARTGSRSIRSIIAGNLFTRFNAIMTPLAVIVLVFGAPLDAVFALVMVSNAAIGIIQELRAKRTLDALQLLVEPTIIVVRDGAEQAIPVDEIVADEVIELRAGDQIPVDGVVSMSRGLEVDESALTGEADPIGKSEGDVVRSGSAAVAGSARIVTTAIGDEVWIQQLLTEAKEFVLTQSELRRGVDRLLTVISWILPPLAALLFWSQLRHHSDLADGLVAATAGVVALIPQGLVLLVSMAMAVAVVSLARRRVVVQELGAVEGLARADIVCLDKTGTLTTGHMTVEAIEIIHGSDAMTTERVQEVLAALAELEPTPTAAMQTIRTTTGPPPSWRSTVVVPFSSARKWSGASFDTGWTWVMGAPEILLASTHGPDSDEIRNRVADLTHRARRVLVLGRSALPLQDLELPEPVEPVALIVMVEELRSDAAATLAYFRDEGFTVKIISGDSVDTVKAMGAQLGIPGVEDAVDLRSTETITTTLAEQATIFGRVSPEQKRDLVVALQAGGHSVVMTGDGVNDIPALKRADIGIAMDTATSATKAVSQVVLLDGRFDLLPGVLAEGRRVVANMERVSSLFIAKTVYALVFVLAVVFVGEAFPFRPRHLTVVDSLTIGIPAFILSFQPASAPCRPGYLRRVLRFSIPAGLAAAVVTLFAYSLEPLGMTMSLQERQTLSTMALTVMAFWILLTLIRPLRRWHVPMLAALMGAAVAVFIAPPLADLAALSIPPLPAMAATLAAAAMTIPAVSAFLRSRVDDPERTTP